MSQDKGYTLATGESGAYRLQILNAIHQPYTEYLLERAGLSPGMNVADIGCGTGNVSVLMASKVGRSGSVCGVDMSEAQLDIARSQATSLSADNVTFTCGSAYDTRLPEESFDLVYSRFLLMHLNQPGDALLAMLKLVKPGGLLVCEEADISCSFCNPTSAIYDRCFELFLAISDIRNQHFRLGATLYRLFQDVGLANPEACLIQPIALSEYHKRLIDLSLFELADGLIEVKLTTRQETDQIISQLRALAADEKTVFGVPRVTQVWARK